MHCLKENKNYSSQTCIQIYIMIQCYVSKRLPIIFFCIFLFSIIGVTFHHHIDCEQHDDCPLCMFSVHNIAVIPQDDYQVSATFFTVNTLHISKYFFIPYIFKNVLSIRGPPS